MARRSVGLGMLVMMLVLAACGGGTPPSAGGGEAGGSEGAASGTTISVGSKDFIEAFILGEMYALLLEEQGFTVERKFNLGATDVAHAAMESGEIDLYPEYTGTGLLTVLKLPVMYDAGEVYETVSAGYAEQFNMIWLDPSPMNNTQTLAMTRDRAEELGITKIADVIAQASDLVVIAPAEFQEREDGLPGLKAAYGDFTLKELKAVDPGLRYRALVDGEGDVTLAFGTDGEVIAYDLVLLEDDKQLFPPYNVAPLVRGEVLEANPQIADALNQLAPLLTNETMQQLNNEVSGNQREPEDVAREFLLAEGLITE